MFLSSNLPVQLPSVGSWETGLRGSQCQLKTGVDHQKERLRVLIPFTQKSDARQQVTNHIVAEAVQMVQVAIRTKFENVVVKSFPLQDTPFSACFSVASGSDHPT
jgi:hypothetical protein